MTAPAIAVPMPGGLRCATCNKAPSVELLAESEYRCPDCGADLAHLDLAPSGMVRRVLGWLRSPGEVLAGRYRVRGMLGKGGMAATYLVDDLRLAGKRRAIKEIPEPFFDEPETEILARIHHPAVPDITDRFTADGMVYLVLEFGGERTLEGVRAAEGGKVPLARLRPWIDQLCDVLAYLHAQRPPIVHRDLKPANVLLDEADRVMLIDFGIAKQVAPDTMTRMVACSASHGFSPPEQVLGTGTDERSDVYALGATLYVLLTGEIPPPAHERVAGAELIPPRQLLPELPKAVEDAILRALELSMARRHPSIAEFRRALGEARAPRASADKDHAPRTVLLSATPSAGPIATATTSAGAKAVASAAIAAPRRQGAMKPVLFGAIGLLLVVVAGAAWWLTRGGDENVAKQQPVTDGPAVATPAQHPSSAPTTVFPLTPPSPPASTGTPTTTLTSLPSAPQPATATTAAAPTSGPSALEELLRNLPAEPEAEPAATQPPSGIATSPPSTGVSIPKKPEPSVVEQIREPPAQGQIKKAPRPRATAAKKPAGTGWEGFQGATSGYERKIP